MQKKETETGREAEKNEQYRGRPDLAGQNGGKGRGGRNQDSKSSW